MLDYGYARVNMWLRGPGFVGIYVWTRYLDLIEMGIDNEGYRQSNMRTLTLRDTRLPV